MVSDPPSAAPTAHAARPPPPPTSARDRDSITRDKERLQRFHTEAISFLTKAYSNDTAVLVEDRFDDVTSAAQSSDDFLANRRVQLDRLRLQRFHDQAVSFLHRAYADEPGTIVEEEALSPMDAAAVKQDRELLTKFHAEAMSFLEVAAGGAADDAQPGTERVGSSQARRRADRTSLRIARDKARLEENYQEAMSLLEHAEMGGDDVLVEEQELELAVVERFKLQRYAQDAMEFLDKAFQNDASVMVGDEEDVIEGDNPHAFVSDRNLLVDGQVLTGSRHRPEVTDGLRQQRQVPGMYQDKVHREGLLEDEDRQIAADRAALERYDEEVGDFLSKAYLDDATVIVDDVDSETSGTEGGLFARRVNPSTSTSTETGGATACSGSATFEDFSEDASLDDDFGCPSVAEAAHFDVLRASLPAQSNVAVTRDGSCGDRSADEDENLHNRIMRYEREAADILDGANITVENDEEDYEVSDGGTYPRLSPMVTETALSGDNSKNPDVQSNVARVLVDADEDDEDNEDFGSDRHIDDSSIPRAFYDDDAVSDSGHSGSEFSVPLPQFPDRIEMPKPNSAVGGAGLSSSQDPQDLLMDVIMEDETGASQGLSHVRLERSFYHRIPRGSTIKLRPFSARRASSGCSAASDSDNKSVEQATLNELQRVEKERDTLMATLEDIVNERSMLAAQVSEMKVTMQGTAGAKPDFPDNSAETEVMDLATELKEAHETMAKLSEEMEATLGVLDNRYQETLQRAHKAEEKCIRLESNASRLENEFSKQGIRLSQVLADEGRLSALLEKTCRQLDVQRQKSELELKRLDERHKEELDRSVEKILELTTQVSELQKTVNTRSTVERDVQEVIAVREKEIQELSTQIEKLKVRVREGEKSERDLRRLEVEASKLSSRNKDLEHAVEDLRRDVKSAKRGQVTAEIEAQHVRTRYEESLKKWSSRMDQKAEMLEIQTALDHLKEETGAREKRLLHQLAEFRVRAEQAEAAASTAARGAKEAVQSAKLAQERSHLMVESERKARKAAEAEKQVVTRECKEWEKFAQQQMDLIARNDGSSGALAKSSSRRGLRRSPSKGAKENSKKKRDGRSAGSAAEETTGKKKSSLRPRLFG